MMKARSIFSAVNPAKTVAYKNGKSVTSYYVNENCQLNIKHKTFHDFETFKAFVKDQPLLARAALVITHKDLFPASRDASKEMQELVNPYELAEFAGAAKKMIPVGLTLELDNVRRELNDKAYQFLAKSKQ